MLKYFFGLGFWLLINSFFVFSFIIIIIGNIIIIVPTLMVLQLRLNSLSHRPFVDYSNLCWFDAFCLLYAHGAHSHSVYHSFFRLLFHCFVVIGIFISILFSSAFHTENEKKKLNLKWNNTKSMEHISFASCKKEARRQKFNEGLSDCETIVPKPNK